MKKLTTRINFGNDQIPCLIVHWDETDMGYDGVCYIYGEGGEFGTKLCEHKISISRGTPIGDLFVTLDNIGYGCWAMVTLSADTINERDLQWATAWAVQAIERKHKTFECSKK